MIVMVQLDALAFVIARMAVRAIARTVFAAPDVVFRTPLDVVRHHQIEPAIFVVIEPSCAGRPSTFIRDSGLCRYIRERAIPVIVIQDCPSITCDINIWIAIVIEVTDSRALAVMSLTTKPRFLRSVSKRAVTVVVIQSRTKRMGGLVKIGGCR